MFSYFSEIDNDEVIKAVEQDKQYALLQSYFSPIWLYNFYTKEVKQVNDMLSGKEAYGLQITDYQYLINFDPEILELIETYAPKHHDYELVMAGCGPYPETLIRMYMSTICTMNRFNGLDSQHEAITMAQKLCERFLAPLPDREIYFTQSPSERYDYGSAGVIILANSLRNKRMTLERIAATMPENAVIIVRNPMRLGKLIQEDVFNGTPLVGITIVKFVPIGIKSSIYVFKKAI